MKTKVCAVCKRRYGPRKNRESGRNNFARSRTCSWECEQLRRQSPAYRRAQRAAALAAHTGKKRSSFGSRWSGQVHPCPDCASTNTRCYCTRRPVRYHKCLDCEAHWKSTERVVIGEPLRAPKVASRKDAKAQGAPCNA